MSTGLAFSIINVVSARTIWIKGTTNDGSTLSIDTLDSGLTWFKYSITDKQGRTRDRYGATSWCYKGQISANPNFGIQTPKKPGWIVYTDKGRVDIFTDSTASYNLLATVCGLQ
ncbi:MAG: hypothetical protein ACRAVC_09585 [Trichormus sp.]